MSKHSLFSFKDDPEPLPSSSHNLTSVLNFTKTTDHIIYAIALILIIISSITLPIFAWSFSSFIQLFSTWQDLASDQTYFTLLLIIILATAIIAPILFLILRALIHLVARRIVSSIRQKYAQVLLKNASRGLDLSVSPQELSIKLEEDCSVLLDALGPRLATYLWTMSSLVMSMILAFVWNWELSLILLVLIPILYFAFKLFREMLDPNLNFSQRYEKAEFVVLEVLYNIKAVVSLGGEYRELARYKQRLLELESQMGSQYLWHAFSIGGTSFLFYLGFASALFIGVSYLKDIPLIPQIGEQYKFAGVICVAFCVFLCIPLMHFAAPCLIAFRKARSVLRQILPVIEAGPIDVHKSPNTSVPKESRTSKTFSREESQPRKGEKSKQGPHAELITQYQEYSSGFAGAIEGAKIVNGKITFNGVTLTGHYKDKHLLFNNFTMEIQSNSKVAIVLKDADVQQWTHSFCNLLQGIKKPEKGSITLDDNSIQTLAPILLRSNIMDIPEDPIIFPMTLRENLTLKSPDLSNDDILKKIREVDHDKLLSSLKNKLDLEVGLDSSSLSDQEKLLVGIIRVVLADPKVIIVTGKVFEILELYKISKVIQNISKGKTLIIICQSIQSIRGTDKLILVERGTADEVKGAPTDENIKKDQRITWIFESPQKGKTVSEYPIPRLSSRAESIRSSLGLQVKIDPGREEEEELVMSRINSEDLRELNEALGYYEESFAYNPKQDSLEEWHEKLWQKIQIQGGAFLMALLPLLANCILVPLLCTLVARFMVTLMGHSSIIDNKKIEKSLIEVIFIAALVFGCYLIGISRLMWFRLKASNALRAETFARILRMHMAWHDDSNNTPDKLSQQLKDDVNKASAAISINQSLTIQMVLNTSVAVLLTLFSHPELGLISLAFILILVVTYNVLERVKDHYKTQYKAITSMTSTFTANMLVSIPTVQRLPDQQTFFTLLTKLGDKSMALQRNSSFCTDIFTALACLVLFANIGVILTYGLPQFLIGETLLEGLVVCLIVPLFSIFELIKFRFLLADHNETSKASENLYKYFETRSQIDIEDKSLRYRGHIEGNIEFKNVVFRYPGQRSSILKGLSCKLDAGNLTVIMGDANSGKEVIGQLLLRLYDVDYGEILIDHVNVKNYNLHYLRKKIGVVFERPQLFKGSVERNINYIEKYMPSTEVREAAKKADLFRSEQSSSGSSRDLEMPEIEGEISGILSYGHEALTLAQQHKVTIARTLLRRPGIFVYEAFGRESSQDYQGILRNVREMTSKGTRLVVTDYYDVENKDYDVVVMRNGQAEEVRKINEEEKELNLLDE